MHLLWNNKAWKENMVHHYKCVLKDNFQHWTDPAPIHMKKETMKIIPNGTKWQENLTNTVFGIFRHYWKITSMEEILLKKTYLEDVFIEDDFIERWLNWKLTWLKMTSMKDYLTWDDDF